MGEGTKIEWTDHTFNPWWGCQRVSPGCEHCYAETFSKRVGLKVWGPQTERRFFGEKHWREPIKWDASAARDGVRRRVFCASMADVFEDREDLVEPRTQVFDIIARTPHLDWLLLTKRPQNIARMIPWGPLGTHRADPDCWRNVWLGTTAEDQKRADERIPELLKVPAAVRFVSYEPALGPIDFFDTLARAPNTVAGTEVASLLHWIIVGGESGPGARPFDLDWARNTAAQCKTAGIACFVKQMGSNVWPSWECEWVKHEWKIPTEHELRFRGKTVATVWNNGDRATWHTWDAAGIGGYNSTSATVDDAKRDAERALADMHVEPVKGWSSHKTSLRDRKGGDWNEWAAMPELRVREWPKVRP